MPLQGLPYLSFTSTLRLVYARRQLSCITTLFLFSYATLTYSIHIIERDCNPDFVSMGDSAWFMITTMTTVGYGDIHPIDGLGRLIASFACVWGVVLLALICLYVTDGLSLSEHEGSLLRRLLDRDLERGEAEAAASLIQQVWRVRGATLRGSLAPIAQAAPPAMPPPRLQPMPRTALEGTRRPREESWAGAVVQEATSSTAAAPSGPSAVETPSRSKLWRSRSAEAVAVAAAQTTRHRRLTLLHTVQRQREQRRLLKLEASMADLLGRRMEAVEKRVTIELRSSSAAVAAATEALRHVQATQTAQHELLMKLSSRLEHLGALYTHAQPESLALGRDSQQVDASRHRDGKQVDR